MNRRVILGIVLPLAAVGCAPMEQAPLVYSSTAQFGVQMAGGAPDTPGLSVNIGFKSVDAAYVPVAIAKYCGSKPEADCENAIYELQKISGSNKRGGKSQVDPKLLAEVELRLLTNRREVDRENSAIAVAKGQLLSNAVLRDNGKKLEAEKALLATAPEGETAEAKAAREKRLKELEVELKKVSGLRSDESLNQSIANRTAKINGLLPLIEADAGTAERMRATRNAEESNEKDDAYSVYGSFNGGSRANSEGAALELGKVFSTGVAAQNVTQGIQDASVLSAQAGCMEKVLKVAEAIKDDTLRNQFLVDTRKLCSVPNKLAE